MCEYLLIIKQIIEDMKIVQEEIFGFVVIIFKFKNFGEVVVMVNNSSYGFFVVVFIENLVKVYKVV